LNKDIEKMFLFLWEIGREMNMWEAFCLGLESKV
jgi:hypothetical protein